jgi:predicted acetyltransferase
MQFNTKRILVLAVSADELYERFKDYKFVTPPVMVDEDLELKLVKTFPCTPEKDWFVPVYTFAMVNAYTGAVMGDIDLRVGLTEKLKVFGGHLGYEVAEPYRGHRFATRSCRLLLPFVRELGINPVIITCAPDNIPSVKTIEALGAVLVEMKNVEIEPGVLRKTNIYHLAL